MTKCAHVIGAHNSLDLKEARRMIQSSKYIVITVFEPITWILLKLQIASTHTHTHTHTHTQLKLLCVCI